MIGDSQRLVFKFDSQGSQKVVGDTEKIQRAQEGAGQAAREAADLARAAIEAQTTAIQEQRAEIDRLRKEAVRQSSDHAKALRAVQAEVDKLRQKQGTPPDKPPADPVKQLNDEIEKLEKQRGFNAQLRQSERYISAVRAAAEEQDALARAIKGTEDALQVAKTPAELLNDEIQALGEQRAFDRQRLASKEYVDALKAAAVEQRKLERATMSFSEKLAQDLEVVENFTGALDAVLMLKDALVGLYEVARQGAVLRDVAASMERIERAGGASSSALVAASGGRLTGGQAGAAGIRGTLGGLSSGEQTAIASLASVAGQRALLTGEAAAEDIGAITLEMTKALQDELQSGELGATFQALGVNQAEYELALREEARIRGTGVDGLDVYTRRQILLNQALEEGAEVAQLLATSSTDSMIKIEQGFRGLGEDIAAGLAPTGVGGSTPIDAGDSLRERARLVENLGGRGADFNAARLREEAEAADAAAAQQRFAENRLKVENELLRLGASQKATVAAILEGRGREATLTGRLSKDQRDRLVSEGGIAQSLADQLNSALSLEGRHAIARRLRAESLADLKRELDGQKQRIEAEQANASNLTAAARVMNERKLAVIEEKQAMLDTVTSLAEYEQKTSNLFSITRQRLAEEAAIADSLASQASFLTESEKAERGQAAALAKIKTEAADIARNADEYNRLMVRAGLTQALNSNEKLTKALEKALKKSTLSMTDLVDGATTLGHVLSAIPGVSSVGEGAFKSILGESEDKKKSGGGGGADARKALLERAGLIGLDELDAARAQAESELQKNLKVAGKNKDAIVAARAIYWDQIRAADEKFADVAMEGAQTSWERYVNVPLEAGFQRGNKAVEEYYERQRQEIEAANATISTALFQYADERERARAQEFMQLESEEAKRLEAAAGNRAALLSIEAEYEARRAEMALQHEEQRAVEAEQEAERYRSRGAAQRAFFEDAMSRTAQFDDYLEQSANRQARAKVAVIDGAMEAAGASFQLANEIQAIQALQLSTGQQAGAIAAAGVGAAAQFTAGLTKNLRVRAGLLALMEVAHSAAAFASGNLAGGTAHALAAVKYGVVAATRPSGSGKRGRPDVEVVSQRRSLDRVRTDGGGRTQRAAQPVVINQVFVTTSPITGSAVARVVNDDVRRGKNIKIHNSVTGRPSRTEL